MSRPMSQLDRLLVAGLLALAAATGPGIAQTEPSKTEPSKTEPAPPAAAGAPAAATTAPVEAPLKGLAAWEKLKGNTITGKSAGEAFSEYFEAGGGVRYVDKDGLSTGTWAVKGTEVCVEFPEDDDKTCSAFTVTGTSGRSLDDDGSTTTFDILLGNSKGL